MATVFDATWGGSSANSYITESDADSYITTTVLSNSGWASADTSRRQAALIQATRDIDGLNYIGTRFYHDQALLWPRVLNAVPTLYGNVSLEESNDQFQIRSKRDIQGACCIQAAYLLSSLSQANREHPVNIASGIKQVSKSVGPIREQYTYGPSSSPLDSIVRNILSVYVIGRRCFRG